MSYDNSELLKKLGVTVPTEEMGKFLNHFSPELLRDIAKTAMDCTRLGLRNVEPFENKDTISTNILTQFQAIFNSIGDTAIDNEIAATESSLAEIERLKSYLIDKELNNKKIELDENQIKVKVDNYLKNEKLREDFVQLCKSKENKIDFEQAFLAEELSKNEALKAKLAILKETYPSCLEHVDSNEKLLQEIRSIQSFIAKEGKFC
ncbi:hypothetical protein BLOT_003547 [Blomia tropicalis]|nr:hypothetical protein BLOT_003547 [Blomia tropicalis]